MAINGKTLTTVEGLVTSTTTTEGNFRAGMDDVLTQVNSNEEVATAVDSEKDRLYSQIRSLRAGNWNYITRRHASFNAATRLDIFGSTAAIRAGRYRFMVVGAGGGGRAQDGNTHWGGGAGGMVAFDYVWDGATAPSWTIGDGGLRLASAGGSSTLTLSNGVVATSGGGGAGFSNQGAGGSASISGTHSTVTNILTGIGGRGGHRNGSGDSPGGGAVNVFALGSDHTATEGLGGPSNSGGGGSVWGPGAVLEDGTTLITTGTYFAPNGQYMGNLAPGGASGANDAEFAGMYMFGSGTRLVGSSNQNFPGMFGGLGANLVDSDVSHMFGGGGGGASSPGLDGCVCWCRMGDS